MPYIGTQPKDVRSFGKVQFDFTATQGQTAFTGADDDGKTLGFTEGQIQVYVNGILMDASDYTTSNTNTVTLGSAANLNDIITVVALQTDIPNSDYVPSSGGTFSGNVIVDGNVGIGTSSPSYLIDAKTSSGNAQARILSGGDLSQLILESTDTAGNSQINFADADSNNIGMLQYFHSDNHMEFTVNSAERMRIDSSGKVGIGTTSPSGLMHLSRSGGADEMLVFENTQGTDPFQVGQGNDDSLRFYHNLTERMRIDSTGRVTKPDQPSFYASLSSDVAQNISAKHRVVPYNETRHNHGNHFNTSTGLFTAPVGGVYQFNSTVRFNNVSSGTYMLQKLYVNPTISSGQVSAGSNPDGMYNISTQLSSYNTCVLCCTLKLSANDTVCITGYANSDTSWSFDNNSHFSGYLLG